MKNEICYHSFVIIIGSQVAYTQEPPSQVKLGTDEAITRNIENFVNC